MDPLIPRLVAALLVVIGLALVLRRLRQPIAVVYIIAGVLLGPQGLGLLEDRELLARLGEYGVLLLLFFLGMHISLPSLLREWRIPVLGTLTQIGLSLGVAMGVSSALGWPWQRGLLLGFVIGLSSTAVVLKVLEERGELESVTGRDVVGILLIQDLAIAPMLVVLGMVGGQRPSLGHLALQVVTASVLIGLAVAMARRKTARLPFAEKLEGDHELQVFVAFLACLGFALVSGLAGLSTAFGAFVAGIVIGTAKETHWVHHSLEPFRVVLVAVFLMSVGAVLDLQFLRSHLLSVSLLTLAAFATNFLVNGVILRALGRRWPESLYGAALLAQVGEFSFILAAVGLEAEIISGFGHQLTISVIAVSLLFAPGFVMAFDRLRARPTPAAAVAPEP